MAKKRSEIVPRGERRPARRGPFPGFPSSLDLFERLEREMDRVFDDFGFGRRWPFPRPGRSWWRLPWHRASEDWEAWVPEIEVFQRKGELVVRADLPGLTKDDVKVDVTQDDITIQGERKHARDEERAGLYRSERSYGAFRRVIPLPEGAVTDQAKATFKDGVLEITVPAPEQAGRGRRLEIEDGSRSNA
jgi:HSP20 family protein